MDTKNTQTDSGVIVVKDPSGLVLTLGGIVFFAIITLWSLFEFNIPSVVFGGIGTYLTYLVYKTKNEGVILDLNNDSFSYPGGKAADEITDYIKLEFIKQNLGMSRQRIKLSEISSISAESTRTYNTAAKMYQYYHVIQMNGVFGSITIPFGSQSKRDQLYTVLREKLNMGSPVVIAN